MSVHNYKICVGYIVIITFLFFISTLQTTAQQQQRTVDIVKVLGIAVEGQKSADPNAIITNTGIKVGDEIEIPGEKTRDAIRRLYNLRLFDDIQILVENRIENGVYLLIRVRENPRLEKTEIVGNDELSEDDILKKVSLTKGQIITHQNLSTVIRVLKKEYDDKGYLNAVISPELIPAPNVPGYRVVLKITVQEGNRVRLDRIQFFGNKSFPDGDLKSTFEETSEGKWWKFWSTPRFDHKKFEADKEKLLSFYRKNGYRDAEIVRDTITYDETKENLTLHIYVFEGPQYKLRKIEWSGNLVYPTEILNGKLGFVAGEIYDRERFDKGLRPNETETDVSSLYLDNGYLRAMIEPEEIRVGEDSLDIVIRVHEGNQFRIGRVRVQGNTKTYDKVIRRELFTRPGDFFSRQAIVRSARQLAQLNYFNPEKIRPDLDMVDEKTVDLIYSVEEKSSDTFNTSVGYSGAFGFNGAIGLSFNNFSLIEPFRGGAGQQLAFDWQFGEANRYQTFSISFTEPWLLNSPTLFGVSLYDTRQIYYYDLQITGGSVRVGRRFKWPDFFFRGDWTVRFQENNVKNGGGFYTEGKTSQVSVGQVISRNSTDSPIFPTRGSNFSLLTELSGGPFLPGTADYTKHIFSAEWYIPILNSSRVALALSSNIGFIFGIGSNAYVPPQEHFYMGGTGLGQIATMPLRGYDDRSIGPQSGGKATMKHQAELRFALSINPIPIYILGFAEAGNVWQTQYLSNPLDLKRSAGAGVRLLINPIGMVGFDYGYGFDGPLPGTTPSGWKFHFQFGRGF
jgi:outer membrane protein insertion porin family